MSPPTHPLQRLLERNPPLHPRPLPPFDRQRTEQEAEQLMEAMWSEATWVQYRSLWRRLQEFAASQGRSADDGTMVLFIQHLPITTASKHTYARTCINILNRMGHPHPLLTMYDKGLRSSGGEIPLHQAEPMRHGDLLHILPSLPPLMAQGLMLAWKTASRWDEIARLQRTSVLQITEDEIVLYFGAETKTSRTSPFRPELFCVVRGPWTKELGQFLRQRMQTVQPGLPLIPVQTAAVTLALAPYGYSAHSIKRGALSHVMAALPEGSPHFHILSLLAKHARSAPAVTSVTLRYVEQQVLTARQLGTGLLTSLL